MCVHRRKDPCDEQTLVLLGLECPQESREDLIDRWSGVSTGGVFAKSVLVHVLARTACGRVMGFVKAFIMATQARVSEVYLDEALVGEADRGQRLLQHLVVALIDACKAAGSRVTRVRGQCKRGEKLVGDRSVNLHEHVYTPMGLGAEYSAPVSVDSPWCGTGPDDSSYIMWYGQGAAVREAAAAIAAKKPLGQGVSLSVHLGGWCAGANAAAAAAAAAAASATSDDASNDAASDDDLQPANTPPPNPLLLPRALHDGAQAQPPDALRTQYSIDNLDDLHRAVDYLEDRQVMMWLAAGEHPNGMGSGSIQHSGGWQGGHITGVRAFIVPQLYTFAFERERAIDVELDRSMYNPYMEPAGEIVAGSWYLVANDAASDDAANAADATMLDAAMPDAAMPDAATSDAPASGAAAANQVAIAVVTTRACSERRLLPPDSPYASPGGLLEQLEALERTAITSRLQGTARIRLSQARDCALLAVAHHAIQARESGASTGGSETEADLYTRQHSFLLTRGVGVSAFSAALTRCSSRMKKTRDEYVSFLISEAADLIVDLRRAARLTPCAPRAAVRETEVRVTGSRGERLLGGTERARATVLRSEYEQAVRVRKRLEADVQRAKAREADLLAKKQATEKLAREAAGEAPEAEGEAAGSSAAHAQGQPKRRRV
jgi:hypothetical protein